VRASHRETLPAALHLAGRSVLVLGGGDEALAKVALLRRAQARVTLVAEQAHPELARAARSLRLTWFARPFVETDLIGCRLVMLTEPDAALAGRLAALRQRHPFWLCAIDQPEFSDLFMVSSVRRGPLQISISTGGGAPLLARRLRQELEACLDPGLADFARSFADLRAGLKALSRVERERRLEEALHGFALEVRVSYPGRKD
jgi:uroporphyrin-III C-methyltransferase / precorrin-2 dehydrogenase / sirohydrochlorin ferrochelatase